MSVPGTHASRPGPSLKRPSESEVVLARLSSRRLGAALAESSMNGAGEPSDPICLVLKANGEENVLEVPRSALLMLQQILSEMAAGHAVALHPVHAELTTQEAADLLGVSRPFLTKRLDGREIPCRKVGSHRRILYEDLLTYKKTIDDRRSDDLDELAAQAQELALGY